MKWFSVSPKKQGDRVRRRGMKKTGLVYTDSQDRKWNVSVFRRSSVGAWWSEEDWDWSREIAVLFEQGGEERVAVADVEYDLDSEERLAALFAKAIDRRSGGDRRGVLRSVVVDRRENLSRRWTDT